MKYGLLIALLTLGISASSRSEEFGTTEEVFEAAKSNQEPAYIPKLMEAFGRELASQTPDLSTSERRQAFLVTMASIVGLHVAVGRDAARDGIVYPAQAAAEAASRGAAGDVPKEDAALYAAWVNRYKEARARIAYRIAEWKMLNFILERRAVLIPKVYEAALSYLPCQGYGRLYMSMPAFSRFEQNILVN